LADPTRQKLLQLLLAEELNVSELVEILGQPQSTISRQLKILRSAGLAHDRREGTTALYSATEVPPDGADLKALLLGWLRQQPLPKAVRDRLRRVLERREDAAVGFFERIGNRWDDLRAEAFGEVFATEAFLGLLPREWTVADIGTGTGYLLPALAEHFRQVVAVDPAAAMLECARRRVTGGEYGQVTFHQGDLGHLPIGDQGCDLAIACLVLHHVEEPVEALAEMVRVLRPGGRILVVEQESHENQAFYERMQDRWWGFEAAGLARRLEEAGFQCVRHHRLATVRAKSGSAEAPGLFVVTGERPQPCQEVD
jgi:ArsR family transcriptional regulator